MIPVKPTKNWQQRSWPPGFDIAQCRTLATELKLPLPIIHILLQRGLSDPQEIETFLKPALKQLPSPFSMKGMNRAVILVTDAVKKKKPIIIYGDYDVDGVTGIAVLIQFLQALGAQVSYYQPDRLTEGYGLNHDAIKNIYDINFSSKMGGLLITVDCGISDIDEIKGAKHLGFSIIISDHHKPPEQLPPADAILNPLQSGCAFPFKALAGVGVAFYLVMGIRQHLYNEGYWSTKEEIPNLKMYLDLVALGTMCDLVPLQGINRILVKAGLEVMGQRKRPGIKILSEIAKIADRVPTGEDILFRLGPRINAAGRIGKANRAVKLLTTDNEELAQQLANELELANMERKLLQKQLVSETLILAESIVKKGSRSLVLSGKNWHKGILGIVAARLTEQFCRPTVLLSIEDSGKVHGSGRSIPEINLYDTLSACSDLLVGYGGHGGAAGLTMKIENIEVFRNQFEKNISEQISEENFMPKLTYDYRITFEELFDENFLRSYDRLPPFGCANPEPVFRSKKTQLLNLRTVGGSHLKFSLKENGTIRQGVGFGFGYLLPESRRCHAELAIHLRTNEFQGRKRRELHLVDMILFSSD